MNKTILLTIVTVALLGLVPGVIGQNGAGLSGECYNADGSKGGKDEARVTTAGVVLLPGTVGDPTGQADGNGGAVPALQLFATESVNDGGQTGAACKRYDCRDGDPCTNKTFRRDYLEVDARFGAVFVQVCYDASVKITGECPTSPTGPGTIG